ncbi:zinc finger CCCH domain-containing protein 65-like isoform X2 [Lotus japonicus]|uniref:zinc finger CCCH domain-containing protein 65-like isoform X2 n=1 Tax=Lotus japonicus TaxID=34305 RepID=UPI00258827E7|nr:zinc finger CCCH domain-containing protein 65-like isoform X2 [Lotus japonicus]
MEDAELGTSKSSSQFRMPFPPYRRSHLRSQTVHTLHHILSHLSAASTAPTSSLNTPENGDGRMGQENEERERECAEFVASDLTDPKASVSQKEILEVHENIEGNGDRGKDFSANEMVLDDIELLLGMEETSTQANDFNDEQKVMAELEMVVNGIDDLVQDIGLIPLNSGLGEKQNDSNEVELMDYQVEHVEFLHPDVDTSGNASKLQVSGDNNQLTSEGFHPPLIFHAPASTVVQASPISTSRFNNGSQQQETELVESVCAVVNSLPSTEEGGQFEKEEHDGLEVAEATHISLDLDMNNEELNISEDGGLMDSTILEGKHEVQNEGEKLDVLTSVNNVTNSSNVLIEKGNVEQGEIYGEQEMQNEGETLERLMSMKNATSPSNILIENGDMEEGEISGDFEMDGNSFDISSADMPTDLTQNKVFLKGFLEESQETTAKEHGNSSAVKIVGASRKREGSSDSEEKKDKKKMPGPDSKEKCGPGADEEKKDKEKQLSDASTNKKRGPSSKEKKVRKKRKRQAKKNRELGVKRLKLLPVQKEKAISYCRHYLNGRCNEGDKCHFSHDTVPKTKSKACHHFARHSCMKGDDCPYDHELSKYPCNNFVSSGSCSRGDTCMFSHQVPTNQDIPTPSNVCKPQPASLLNNHGFKSIQQNHLKRINSLINPVHHMVADTSQKQPTPAPKGIRFINAAKLSPSPSTLKQGMLTPNTESLVQHGTLADRSASGTSTTQSIVEISKKLPAVAPKGINFLSFGKGPVCSFKSSMSFHVNRENGIKLPQVFNFGLPYQASPSIDKDGSGKVSDGTKNVPQTDLSSNEILNKVLSVAEEMKSKFPGKASKDDSAKDNSRSKSVQEGKKVSNNSSECLVSGYHKLASRSSKKALSSTLAFAAEHESDIKMKLIVGGSSV